MFEITHATPADPALQSWIRYYYVFRQGDADFREQFIHYPHYRTTLNVYRHARIDLDKHGRQVKFEQGSDLQTVFTHNVDSAKYAQLLGPIDAIGVAFKPLGINQFTAYNFFETHPQSVFFLNDFWEGFDDDLDGLFDTSSLEKKVALLDRCFKGKYTQRDLGVLEDCIQQILDSLGSCSVADVEASTGLSRRTLLRLFRKHLGCSISDFKQVVKFRHAFESYGSSQTKPSLTQLAHDHNYYDQSDFINHFRSLTGEIPSDVLKKLTTIEGDLHWKIT